MTPKQPADSPRKPSQVLKRSILIAGHKTSVTLEDAFWSAFKEIAATRRIRLSDLVSTIDNERQHGNRILAFREGLGASGPGEDPEIVVRIANERLDQLPAMAADLVGQNVQAICAVAPPAVRAARDATSSIPIIAMDLESDPVGNGWVASLSHPGGNITGIVLDLPDFSAKTLQLLREAVPNAAKIAGLWYPPSGSLQLKAVQNAASALGVEFDVFEVNRAADFEAAFQAMAQKNVAGLIMLSSPIFAGNPQLLGDLAIRNRLPAINNFIDFAQNGGLIGYGPELQSLFAQAGLLTRKVI